MLSGFACRLKTLPDGRRQITGLFVPGDFCDLHVIPVQRMGHALATLSPAVIGVLSNEAVRSTMEDHPNIARALWLSALVQEAVTREWLVSLGRRTAFERVAHLICEVYARLAAAGLARHGYCDWPLTQTDLADGLGLSAVHVNRTLQEMRREGLIRLQGRSLHLPDLDRLARAALFDPGYLHWDAPR
jgi:CRP-like cAMP-binding protein